LSVHKTIATFFGLGYSPKAPGTVGALGALILFGCLAWLHLGGWSFLLVLLTLFFVGAYSADRVEGLWGKDNNKVVIDEVLGMGMALLWIPFQWEYYGLAFALFRLFDIWKPLGIRRLEQLKGGWGVMADDLLAGIYANIILHILLYSIH